MFDPQVFVEEKVAEMRERITGKAVIACSGGVDSTVAAVIVDRAIGERLLTVYVDTGLMRQGETEYVRGTFDKLGLHYRMVEASQEFFAALKGVSDPEDKRERGITQVFYRDVFAGLVRESSLLGSFPVSVIPNGFPLDVFV